MSTTTEDNILFAGKLASGVTQYVEWPVRDGKLGGEISWPDATSAATLTLEFTSRLGVAVTVAGRASEWKDSGVSITGPAGTAEGAALLNLENIRQSRARLKIVTTAVTTLDIRDGMA
jgi:hypothetical protein